MKNHMRQQPLTINRLANALGVTRELIQRMTARGFQLQDGRSTVTLALQWLQTNPYPISE